MENTVKDKWIRYKVYRDKKAKEELILQFVPLVKYVVERIKDTTPSDVENDDLVSYGIFGLIDAVERYDYNRGIKFQTYAIPRIRGAIVDELRAYDHTSRSLRQKARQLENAYAQVENQLGRPAKDEEVAKALNLSMEDFANLIFEVSKIPLLSLDEFITKDGDRPVTIGERLEDKQTLNPSTMVELQEIKETLTEGIKSLPKEERTVITLYYYEGLTLKEISKVLGLSESRISQLRTKAVLRLRERLRHLREIEDQGGVEAHSPGKGGQRIETQN